MGSSGSYVVKLDTNVIVSIVRQKFSGIVLNIGALGISDDCDFDNYIFSIEYNQNDPVRTTIKGNFRKDSIEFIGLYRYNLSESDSIYGIGKKIN